MRYRLSTCVLIGLAALWLTSCSTSRTTTREVSSFRVQDSRNTESRDSVTIELRDTLKEVTTITIDRNDAGDTLRVTQITDRTRVSARDRMKDVEVKIVEKTDTVYIATRDSVSSSTTNCTNFTNGKNSFVSPLKWIFATICAIIVLIITVKVCLQRLI